MPIRRFPAGSLFVASNISSTYLFFSLFWVRETYFQNVMGITFFFSCGQETCRSFIFLSHDCTVFAGAYLLLQTGVACTMFFYQYLFSETYT